MSEVKLKTLTMNSLPLDGNKGGDHSQSGPAF